MSECRFVRKNCAGYEYGYIRVDNHALNNEMRTHVVVGKAPTYEEALAANSMAARGMPRIGNNVPDTPLWRNH